MQFYSSLEKPVSLAEDQRGGAEKEEARKRV